jgi:uncharacterized SAM-binding protein YcdF (DUF218 family)
MSNGATDDVSVGRTRWRRVLRVALGVSVLLVAYYVVNLAQVVHTARGDEAGEGGFDAIVVLGAAQYDGRPSPQLAARLDHAIELWIDEVAPVVMVTGGKLLGDRFTEAQASQSYLIDHGVPEQAIRSEDQGATTHESLAAAAEILAAEGLHRVLLVTDPYHALRSKLTAGEAGLDAHVSPTPTSVVGGWTSGRRQILEAGGVAVGRIIGFGRLSGLTG